MNTNRNKSSVQETHSENFVNSDISEGNTINFKVKVITSMSISVKEQNADEEKRSVAETNGNLKLTSNLNGVIAEDYNLHELSVLDGSPLPDTNVTSTDIITQSCKEDICNHSNDECENIASTALHVPKVRKNYRSKKSANFKNCMHPTVYIGEGMIISNFI